MLAQAVEVVDGNLDISLLRIAGGNAHLGGLIITAGAYEPVSIPNTNLIVTADSEITSPSPQIELGDLTIEDTASRLTLPAGEFTFDDVTTPQSSTIEGVVLIQGNLNIGGSAGVLTLDPGAGNWAEFDTDEGTPSYNVEFGSSADAVPNDLIVIRTGTLGVGGTLNLTAISELGTVGWQTRRIVETGEFHNNDQPVIGTFDSVYAVGDHLGYGVFAVRSKEKQRDSRFGRLAFETLESRMVLSADSTVALNEIMYHPADNQPGMEWIEFHNQLATDMDIRHAHRPE